MSVPDRRAVLDRADPKLSIRRQCTLLGIARSVVNPVTSPGDRTTH